MTASTDGSVLQITLQGTVNIQVVALGVVNTVRLLNVQYAENLERNILSYGLLEAKGCVLEYRGGRRVLSSGMGGTPIMDVECWNNVLVVAATNLSDRNPKPPRETMMTVSNPPEHISVSDIQCRTLMEFSSAPRTSLFRHDCQDDQNPDIRYTIDRFDTSKVSGLCQGKSDQGSSVEERHGHEFTYRRDRGRHLLGFQGSHDP